MTAHQDPAGEDRLLASLRDLLPELTANAVVELEVSVGDQRLYLRQRPGVVPAPLEPAGAPAEQPAAESEAGLVSVTTPLSGVFYGAPAPGEPPFVNEGDTVDAGQIVALVEAMKVFNEIHVEEAGTIERVLVAPGQLVQAGQTLLLLRPTGAAEAAGEAP